MASLALTDQQILALATLFSYREVRARTMAAPLQISSALADVEYLVELRAEDIINQDRVSRRPALRLVKPGDTR